MSNELTKSDKAIGMVENLKQSFSAALPSHITRDHFSRALLTSFRKNPALLECSQQSVGAAVMLFAQLGLMVDVAGSGWLIPYGKEAVAVIGYQGLVDLCYRTDRVESICADVVCENDVFEYEQGLNQKLRHVPMIKGNRGEMFAVYAIASIKGSERPVFVVLNREEVEAVKGSSQASKSSKSPWNGNFEGEMWKKTAIKRLTKLLPKSVELASALDYESNTEEKWKEVEAREVKSDMLSSGRHQTRRGRPKKEVESNAADSEDRIKYAEDAEKFFPDEMKSIYDNFGISKEMVTDIDASTWEEFKTEVKALGQ